jgi:hypothetical protein
MQIMPAIVSLTPSLFIEDFVRRLCVNTGYIPSRVRKQTPRIFAGLLWEALENFSGSSRSDLLNYSIGCY